jgi:DNA-directed RNA polymerase specialized sigma24 family protein
METPRQLASAFLNRGAPSSSATLTFDDFFETECTRLFEALAVMSGNRAEAEEVMQEAFLTVWERWDRVAAMDSPTGFLYGSAMNVTAAGSGALQSRAQGHEPSASVRRTR